MDKGNQFRAIDLDIARATKAATGTPRRVSADSPSMTKHEDEALAIHDKPAKKQSMFDKTMGYLGL